MTEKIIKEFVQDFIKKLGETCKDTYEKLRKVYGEGCIRPRQVYECFKYFKVGCDSLKSNEQT